MGDFLPWGGGGLWRDQVKKLSRTAVAQKRGEVWVVRLLQYAPPPFFGGMNIFGGMWGGGGSALGNILDVGADRGQPITLLWTL